MYTVRVTCAKCGRASKFESTDKVRTCPLCNTERTSLGPVVLCPGAAPEIPRSKEAPKVRADRTWSL